MKKIMPLLFTGFVILMSGLPTRAQEATDINLDFSKKCIINPKALDNLKTGDWYRLVIRHINLNLYKVTFDKTDSIIKSTVATPDFTSFSLDNLTKLVGGLSSFSTVSEIISDNTSTIKSVLIARLPKAQISDAQKSLSKSLDEIKRRMEEERIYLQKKLTEVTSFKTKLDDLYLSVYKYQLVAKTETDQTDDYKTLLATPFDFASTFRVLSETRESLKNLQKEVSAKADDYNRFSEEKKKEIEAAGLGDSDKKIKDSYSSMTASLDKLSETINAEKVNQLLTAVVLQNNNKDYLYTSAPQQFNGDVGILHITIEPRGDIPLQKYTTEIHFPKRRLSYVGVGASFYYSGMYDEAYSIKTNVVGSDTLYSLVDEGVKKNEFGMTALLRYGWKFNQRCPIGAHFTFGPAISISNKIKPRVILGGGISIGEKNMLVLDYGLIGGYSDRMSKAFSPTESYKAKPSQPTVSSLQTSWSVSLGYLFKL